MVHRIYWLNSLLTPKGPQIPKVNVPWSILIVALKIIIFGICNNLENKA